MENLLIVGITCSFLLSFLMFAKEEKSLADKIFLIWLIVLIIHFSLLYIRYSGLHWEYPHLLALDTSFGLLHIPLLYLYIKSLTTNNQIKWMELAIHFAPFILINILLVFNFYFLSAEEKKNVYESALEVRSVSITDVLMMAQSMIYFYFSVGLIRDYHRRIRANFSTLEGMNLFWIRRVIIVFGVGFGLKILFNTFVFLDLINGQNFEKIVVGTFCVLLMYLGYHGIRSTTIFQRHPSTLPKNNQYAKSGLKEEDIDKYLAKVEVHIEKHKPYLRDDLTLKKLAGELDLSTNHLSQIINQGAGKSFYDFVNEYRVEEVKEKLSSGEYDHLKILAIAFASGFKSKSTFNTFFKKIEGMPPSDFRNTVIKKMNT